MNMHWTGLSDQDLLEKRISDLGIRIENTILADAIADFYAEIRGKGLSFLPSCFLADEWFCPVGIPAIGIPFYLAHPRLRRLEEKMILEVEGGTKGWFMKLMRHETGHAYSYAYGFYKKKRWQRIFGLASQEYPDTYNPRPYSRSYVIHLDNWYGQSHPDEDFAETVAVWLTPGTAWKRRYRGWKAMEKLEYVDQLMKSVAGTDPPHRPRFRTRDHDGLRIRLKSFYARKRKAYAESYPDFYDNDLKRIFTDEAGEKSDLRAHRFLKNSRRNLLISIAGWTKEKKYTINELLQKFISRCAELNLWVRKDGRNTDTEVASYITTLVMNHLFTGQFKKIKRT